MSEVKPQFNLRNGLLAGFSAFVGMTVTRIFSDEESLLIRILISSTVAAMTYLCVNFVMRTVIKSKGQG
jgi:hypothetical protein